jgi:transcription elongation GreA/GreB family factor
MSRAFVKENDLEHAGIDIPERPISAEINYVTLFGLEQIKETLSNLDADRAKFVGLDDAMSKQKKMRIERDIRYYAARLKSAILVKNDSQKTNRVLFGAYVELKNEDGKTEYYELVGEDEADFNKNKIIYVSPIAKSFIGNLLGDEVVLSKPSGFTKLIIKKIAYK